ncbi:hypothetical protein Cgig2_025994 [Carnegiea gigantea]|uniref:Uncharacterized protein n=1 Tax=Carnegiea gigantea TaxID=171969 RepID=A0A9Q1GLW8_9CARY|nr:hypothetical protein Cgig2_025994 [Carnegiea gigantea]
MEEFKKYSRHLATTEIFFLQLQLTIYDGHGALSVTGWPWYVFEGQEEHNGSNPNPMMAKNERYCDTPCTLDFSRVLTCPQTFHGVNGSIQSSRYPLGCHSRKTLNQVHNGLHVVVFQNSRNSSHSSSEKFWDIVTSEYLPPKQFQFTQWLH